MHPKLIPVTSSWVAGYRLLSGGLLLVALKEGRCYRYGGIPQDLADGLAKADSAGGFLNAVIKKGGFPCTELDEAEVDALLREASPMSSGRKKRTASLGRIPPELLARYPFLAAVV